MINKMYLKMYLLTVIIFVSIDASIAQCDVDKQLSIAACGATFSDHLLSLTELMAKQMLSISQACTRIQELYTVAQQCLAPYQTDCGSDNAYITISNAVQIGYDQITTSWKCSVSNSGTCSGAIQSKIAACMTQFISQLNTTQHSLSLGSPQALQTYCQNVQAIMTQTEQCLKTAVSDNSACDPLIQAQISVLSQTADHLSKTCGSNAGNCGPLAINSCMVNMSTIDMAGNIESVCRIIPGVVKCLDEYKANCGEADAKKQIAAYGLQTFLDMSKTFCSPECSGIALKISQMEQCIVNIPSVTTYSYNSICGHVEGLIKCTSVAIGNCAYLQETFKSQLPGLLQAVSMYGCDITVGSHVYKPKGCDLEKMTACYNPVLQTLDLPTVSRDSNLAQIYKSLSSSNLTNEQSFAQSCSKLKSANVDIKAVHKCLMDEFLKCPIDFLMPMSSQFGKWRNNTGADGMVPMLPGISALPAFDLGDTLSRQELVASTQVFQMLDIMDKLIDTYCTDCTNVTQRITELFTCTATKTSLKISNDIEIQKTMASVVSKFNTRQGYTAECSLLKEAATCTDKYMVGCRAAEYAVTDVLDKPEIYPAFDLCGIKLNLKLHEKLLGCHDKDFVKREGERLHNMCMPTIITENDKLWGMSRQDVCKIVQEQIYCYTLNARCCQTRKQVLEPMMHTWGMLNTLLGCSPALSIDGGINIRSIDSSCDYRQVLTCYGPILKKVGLDTTTLVPPITPQVFMEMFKLKSMMLKDKSLCVTTNEWNTLEKCVKDKTQNCRYASTCQKTFSNHPQMDSLSLLPLADILDFKAVRSICGQECMSASFTNTSYEDCDIDTYLETSGNVAWNDLTGASTTQYCSKIKKVSDCIVPKLGKCQYRIKELHKKLNLNSEVSKEASSRCNVTFSPASQTATAPPTTSTQGPVSGAGHLLSAVVVLIATSLVSGIML